MNTVNMDPNFGSRKIRFWTSIWQQEWYKYAASTLRYWHALQVAAPHLYCSVISPIPCMFWPNLSTIPLANSLARTRYFHRSRTIPKRQPPCNHLNFEGKTVKQYASGQLCAQEPKCYRTVPDMFNFLIYRYTYIYFAEEVGTPWTQQEDLWEKQHYNKRASGNQFNHLFSWISCTAEQKSKWKPQATIL